MVTIAKHFPPFTLLIQDALKSGSQDFTALYRPSAAKTIKSRAEKDAI
jgi:hypothetical protein